VTIATIGERALIARLHSRLPVLPPWVLTGIGDDAAVLKPARGTVDIVTTDALVEDVHFRRTWSTPRDIGHKALAVNLSDLASMGATPRALLLSLALPAAFPLDDFDGLVDGFIFLAGGAQAPLVGGNLTRSPGPLMVNVTAVGSAQPRRVLRRSGARPGDRLFVTGALGAAAAGLAMFEAGDHASEGDLECLTAYRAPLPRLRTGIIVARNRAASACMDLSDGLADAAVQIGDASGCGIELDAATIPVQAGARRWAESLAQSPATFALGGGEDYELLFAVPKRRTRLFLTAVRQAGEASITEIGVCTKTPGHWLVESGTRRPLEGGFRHF